MMREANGAQSAPEAILLPAPHASSYPTIQ